MSDDFVPLNQSTPIGGKWQGQGRNQRKNWQTNRSLNGQRRGNNMWWNHSQRNSGFGSDSNSSFGQEKVNIDAYLHPSMLQDPWLPLRKWLEENKK